MLFAQTCGHENTLWRWGLYSQFWGKSHETWCQAQGEDNVINSMRENPQNIYKQSR